MDTRQQEMLEFETEWYPLGGGSSSAIVERFGLTDRDFFAEVDRIVNDFPPDTMSVSELRRLRGVVRRRLWMAG